MPIAFTFDPLEHRYAVDGVTVPSVTQVLEAVGVSDFSMVPYERLQYAKDLGTAVHQATEAYDQDDLEWESIAGTAVEPYLAGWIEFRKTTAFVPRLIEHRGVAEIDGQRYGWCLDREGELGARSRPPCVLDIKTGQPSRSWSIQLAAYELALFRQDGIHRRRVVVHLPGDGTFKTFSFIFPLDEHVWRWALALECWKQNHP